MICRMCLNESFNLIEIFGEEGHQMGISSVISDHFWFQPTIDDPVSTSICNDCWRNTESFHVFYLNVKTAQDLLAAAQPVAYIVKAEPEEPFEYPNTKSLVSGRQRSNCDNYQSTINVSGSDFTTDSNSGTSFAQKTQAASYANQSALSREGLLKTEPDDYGEVSYTDSQLISPNIALLNEEGMDVGSTALLPSNETVTSSTNIFGRKRKRQPDLWKQNVLRKLRQSGKSYQSQTTGKIVEERAVKEPCKSSCAFSCGLCITSVQRQTIHTEFWKLTDCGKRDFFAEFVKERNVKRRRVKKVTSTGLKKKKTF